MSERPNIKEYFSGFRDRIDGVQHPIIRLNKTLSKIGLPQLTGEENTKTIRHLVDNRKDQIGLIDHVDNYIFESLRLLKQIEQDSLTQELSLDIEKTIEDDRDKIYRRNLWKLWAEKLARWVIGTTIAVLLYSSFVAVSENWCFVKVPGRDLILHSMKGGAPE